MANVPDAMEIREELVRQGYLKAKKAGIRRRAKGKQIPHFTSLDIDGTAYISVKIIFKTIILPIRWHVVTTYGFMPKDITVLMSSAHVRIRTKTDPYLRNARCILFEGTLFQQPAD